MSDAAFAYGLHALGTNPAHRRLVLSRLIVIAIVVVSVMALL